MARAAELVLVRAHATRAHATTKMRADRREREEFLAFAHEKDRLLNGLPTRAPFDQVALQHAVREIGGRSEVAPLLLGAPKQRIQQRADGGQRDETTRGGREPARKQPSAVGLLFGRALF